MEQWIDIFKALCADATAKGAVDGRLYADKIGEVGHYSASDENEFLRQTIKDLIGSNEEDVGISFRQLQDIEKMLVYEVCLSDADNLMPISLLNIIWSCGGSFLPLNNSAQWIEALRLGARILDIGPSSPFTKFNLRSACPRAYDTGHAIKRLRGWGVFFKREGLELIVASGWDDLISRLEAVMREIGGANVVMLVCRHLRENKLYSERLGRYLFGWQNSLDRKSVV